LPVCCQDVLAVKYGEKALSITNGVVKIPISGIGIIQPSGNFADLIFSNDLNHHIDESGRGGQ